ncbi:12833_t:CDS:2 [Acaulospora morrowiae]|uniref:12833_t:CDS:1 n=1 Tax=Acaulospora morrowiae TaxID=94023 RepID=A0A9N9G866_9GLOM|nr:12833_t:CDS:2 [Acaulospora morrowiae]
MENQYLQFQRVVRLWSKEGNSEKSKAFFSPSYFFPRHANIEFYIGKLNAERINSGTNKTDGYRYLLISEDSMKVIKAELELYISIKISSTPTDYNATSYEDIKPIIIDSQEAYEKIEMSLLKFKKSVKKKAKAARANAKLKSIRDSLEKAREMYQENKYLFVAIDVESYERDHSCILEVGWSMYNAKSNLFMDRHFCATEYEHMRNGRFVPDMKERFIFGETIWTNLKSIADEFVKDLTEEGVKGNVVLVGHDIKMEEKYLENMGVEIQKVIKPVGRFDTAEMNAARLGNPHERMALGKILDSLDIENYSLHNAGNDARYTLLLFLELCKFPLASLKEFPQTSDSDEEES